MTTPSMVPADNIFDPLEAAEGVVRGFCRWHVAPVISETWRMDGTGTRMLLVPSLRIVEVTSVMVAGQLVSPDLVEYSEGSGILAFADRRVWPRGLGNIQVSVRHGYESAPGDVLGVIEAVRKRVAQYGGAIATQRAGTQHVSYTNAGGYTAGVPLSPGERHILEEYRLEWGP